MTIPKPGKYYDAHECEKFLKELGKVPANWDILEELANMKRDCANGSYTHLHINNGILSDNLSEPMTFLVEQLGTRPSYAKKNSKHKCLCLHVWW